VKLWHRSWTHGQSHQLLMNCN